MCTGVEGTNAWFDIQVNLGGFPQNQPPAVRIEMDPATPQPGTLVHFHAVTTDPDGDVLAYFWEFDDSSFSTENLAWTYKTYSTAGEYVVRCTVSDMKGASTSVNTVVTVGQSSAHRITGLILDTNGVPIEGVRVDYFADTNAPQQVLGYTDSSGRYALVGITSDMNLSASKYGFALTKLTWTNPIVAGASMLNTDFLATALPVVTVAAPTNEVVETTTVPRSFLVKRTGDRSATRASGATRASRGRASSRSSSPRRSRSARSARRRATTSAPSWCRSRGRRRRRPASRSRERPARRRSRCARSKSRPSAA